jgi:hypothetical protein
MEHSKLIFNQQGLQTFNLPYPPSTVLAEQSCLGAWIVKEATLPFSME